MGQKRKEPTSGFLSKALYYVCERAKSQEALSFRYKGI